MDIKLVISLLAPMVAIGFSLMSRFTNYPQFVGLRKYWLFLLITGVLLLIYRLYKW